MAGETQRQAPRADLIREQRCETDRPYFRLPLAPVECVDIDRLGEKEVVLGAVFRVGEEQVAGGHLQAEPLPRGAFRRLTGCLAGSSDDAGRLVDRATTPHVVDEEDGVADEDNCVRMGRDLGQ